MTRLLLPLLLPILTLAAPEWVADPFDPPPYAVGADERSGGVCRSEFMGGLHAGSYADGVCHIDYGGTDHAQTSFEVLVEPDAEAIRWVAAAEGEVPAGAFPTGAEPWPSDAPDIVQYSCRSDVWVPDSSSGMTEWVHKGMRLGKLVGTFCNVPMIDRVVSAPEYEVLVIEGGTSRVRRWQRSRAGSGESRWYSPDGRRAAPDSRRLRVAR